MALVAALGMAVRRWYLLIPLAMLATGVAWWTYNQMPASYAASLVHQVKASVTVPDRTETREHSDVHRGLTLAPPPAPPDPAAAARDAASELLASVRPHPPAGAAPGGASPEPVHLDPLPDASSITIRVVADTAGHARDAAAAASDELGRRLGQLQDQRFRPDVRLNLLTTTPLTVQPPVRTIGRRVGIATLVFGLAMSVVVAAAVERSARRRRQLHADRADARDRDPDLDPGLDTVRAGIPEPGEALATVSSGTPAVRAPVRRPTGRVVPGSAPVVTPASVAAPVPVLAEAAASDPVAAPAIAGAPVVAGAPVARPEPAEPTTDVLADLPVRYGTAVPPTSAAPVRPGTERPVRSHPGPPRRPLDAEPVTSVFASVAPPPSWEPEAVSGRPGIDAGHAPTGSSASSRPGEAYRDLGSGDPQQDQPTRTGTQPARTGTQPAEPTRTGAQPARTGAQPAEPARTGAQPASHRPDPDPAGETDLDGWSEFDQAVRSA